MFLLYGATGTAADGEPVRKVLSGNAPPGFQTPAKAYGADFVLECEGVTREDVAGEPETVSRI